DAGSSNPSPSDSRSRSHVGLHVNGLDSGRRLGGRLRLRAAPSFDTSSQGAHQRLAGHGNVVPARLINRHAIRIQEPNTRQSRYVTGISVEVETSVVVVRAKLGVILQLRKLRLGVEPTLNLGVASITRLAEDAEVHLATIF